MTDNKASHDRPADIAFTPEMRERYTAIAAIARRTADLVPHTADKFAEPASIFELPTRRGATKNPVS